MHVSSREALSKCKVCVTITKIRTCVWQLGQYGSLANTATMSAMHCHTTCTRAHCGTEQIRSCTCAHCGTEQIRSCVRGQAVFPAPGHATAEHAHCPTAAECPQHQHHCTRSSRSLSSNRSSTTSWPI